MHSKRVLTALVFVPLFYAYVYYLPPHYFLFLLAFLSTAALTEFYAMAGVNGLLRHASVLCGLALLATFFAGKSYFPGFIVASVMILGAVRLFAKRDPAHALPEFSHAVFGILYIPGLLAFQIELARSSAALIILLYTSVWVADSLAYYIGKGLGKTKLFPEVSPNKTVAGAMGSVLGGVLGALGVKYVVLSHVSFFPAVLLGLVIGIISIVGDLVESMIKRDAGVKDSSHIIPGHGGVLDKIDSLTFAGPTLYAVCLALGIIR